MAENSETPAQVDKNAQPGYTAGNGGDMISEAGQEWLRKAVVYSEFGVKPITLGDKSACSALVNGGYLKEKDGRLFITEPGKIAAEQAEGGGRKPVSAIHGRVHDEEADRCAGWRQRE